MLNGYQSICHLHFRPGFHLSQLNHLTNSTIANFPIPVWLWYSSLLVNSRVERCLTDDLMPNVLLSCLPPSCADPKVQGLKVIINCPQPGSSQVTYRAPPLGRWSKCGSNDTVMVLLGSSRSKVPKETQPEWLDPARHWWAGGDASHYIVSSVPGIWNT